MLPEIRMWPGEDDKLPQRIFRVMGAQGLKEARLTAEHGFVSVKVDEQGK